MKFCFEICGEIMSPSDFVIVTWTHAYSFLRLMVFYFELVELSMNLGNIAELGRPEIHSASCMASMKSPREGVNR